MSISHHSESPEERAARELLLEQFIKGAAAKRTWPDGRISGDDDGATAYAIAVDPMRRLVLIRFPKPMDWIGLGLNDAIALRNKLDEKINALSAPSK